MFRSKRWFTLVSAMVLALLAWLMFDDRPPSQDEAESSPPPDTDYYVAHFTLMGSDASGRWSYRLQAERMLHFPATEHWEFEAPQVEFFSAEGANWYGVAERGRAWDEGEHVLLLGEVNLWRPASEQNPALWLDTSEVHLLPAQNQAHTDQAALLRQDTGSYIQGVGARIWLDQERVELQSRVRARYEP